jgi:hypothetical protein
MRSGSPCLSRERRASSAPALRISARSSGLSGPRGSRRTSRLLALSALTSFRSGLVGVLSVVGHHLPQATRRSGHHLRSAARKDGWGRKDKHPAGHGAISGCNQILTKCSGSRGGLTAGNCLSVCLSLPRASLHVNVRRQTERQPIHKRQPACGLRRCQSSFGQRQCDLDRVTVMTVARRPLLSVIVREFVRRWSLCPYVQTREGQTWTNSRTITDREPSSPPMAQSVWSGRAACADSRR